jgi:cytochrome c-type biogenesis protein
MKEHVMESIITIIQQWVSSGSLLLAAGGAFAGGILAGLCPCVLMMVPLLIGFIGGMAGEMTTKRSFVFTMVFIFGFSLELALLFTVGLAAAPFLQSTYMTYFVAAICILLGLHFMGLVKIPIKIQYKAPKHTGLLGAALFGFMFGFTSMPCTGPVLLLLVSVIPAMDPVVGGIMILFYGIGQCLLILIVGTFAGTARQMLASQRFSTANLVFQRAAGILLILVGLYIGADSFLPGLGLGL